MMESITVIKTAAGPKATVMMPSTVLAEAHNNGVRMEWEEWLVYGRRIGMDMTSAILHQVIQTRVLKGVKNIVKPIMDLVIGLSLKPSAAPSLNKSFLQ